MIQSLIDTLHRYNCSCVIARDPKSLTICHGHGISDLYRLLTTAPHILRGASIADKVIGKGAAALMVAGGIVSVYADVISIPALHLLQSYNIPVSYNSCVSHIINRAGSDICPVEALCAPCSTADECIPLISQFINNIDNK